MLDVHMPVMDGCEAIKAIRASDQPWRNVPAIALTADAMSGEREQYLAIGMTDYAAKPVAILAARGGVAVREPSPPCKTERAAASV